MRPGALVLFMLFTVSLQAQRMTEEAFEAIMADSLLGYRSFLLPSTEEMEAGGSAFAPGQESFLVGGAGLSFLFNEEGLAQEYVLITLRPELRFNKVGVGLLMNLRFDLEDQSVRSDDWDTAADVLSLIRYVRYSRKYQRGLYARFGALDQAVLGNGQLVNFYSNDFGLDERKRGLVADYDAGIVGAETIWSNALETELIGGRAYVRPMLNSSLIGFRSMQLGLSYASDRDELSGLVNANAPGEPFTLSTAQDDGALVGYGVDAVVPILSSRVLRLAPYVEYAKLQNYGSGTALGLQTRIRVPILSNLMLRFERRFMGEQYLPGYFNTFYEIERIGPVENATLFNSKRNRLRAIDESATGWYGSVAASVLGLIRVIGSYERTDERPDSGWLRLGAQALNISDGQFFAQASYNRWNVSNEGDLFDVQTPDALLSAEFGVRLSSFLVLSILYQQSFVPIEIDGEVVGHERLELFEPRVQAYVEF